MIFNFLVGLTIGSIVALTAAVFYFDAKDPNIIELVNDRWGEFDINKE